MAVLVALAVNEHAEALTARGTAVGTLARVDALVREARVITEEGVGAVLACEAPNYLAVHLAQVQYKLVVRLKGLSARLAGGQDAALACLQVLPQVVRVRELLGASGTLHVKVLLVDCSAVLV